MRVVTLPDGTVAAEVSILAVRSPAKQWAVSVDFGFPLGPRVKKTRSLAEALKELADAIEHALSVELPKPLDIKDQKDQRPASPTPPPPA